MFLRLALMLGDIGQQGRALQLQLAGFHPEQHLSHRDRLTHPHRHALDEAIKGRAHQGQPVGAQNKGGAEAMGQGDEADAEQGRCPQAGECEAAHRAGAGELACAQQFPTQAAG